MSKSKNLKIGSIIEWNQYCDDDWFPETVTFLTRGMIYTERADGRKNEWSRKLFNRTRNIRVAKY